jgi:methionyl aminopeptidase
VLGVKTNQNQFFLILHNPFYFMETSEINSYKEAGKIWSKAIGFAEKKAKSGVKLLDLAEGIEKLITDEEAEIAFPTNLSINEEAAHFTPKLNDVTTLKDEDLLKIDLGVAVDGFIADGAISINLNNNYAKQIEATQMAFENALSVAEYGKKIDSVSEQIENTLKEKGFNPVYNLGGHGLEKYEVHAEPNISNHPQNSSELFEEGACAIEPFSSTGKGFIGEAVSVEIFDLTESKGVRNPHARKLLNFAEKYNGLPFAERWLRKESKMSDFQATIAIRELMKTNCFHGYPGLKEEKGTLVAQYEKSLIILENETIILE